MGFDRDEWLLVKTMLGQGQHLGGWSLVEKVWLGALKRNS